MTAGSRFQASTPGSEFVDNLIAYYSTEGATKATPSAPGLSCMRPDKSYESSAQSTDSEHAGSRSSESTSSLGDSATAAARVLAAWQDRTGEPPGSAAAAAAAVSIAENTALWPSAQRQQAGTKIHSLTSTPRPSHSAFDSHAREGSAPAPGSVEAGQRRPDMSFLALLNSAAAYVAESSNGAEPGHQQQPPSQQQQQTPESYSARSELLSNASLALSSIGTGFEQGRPASSDEHNGFHSHYGASFSENPVYDFAQVLRHMTTADSESGLAAASAVDAGDQVPFSVPAYGGSNGNVQLGSGGAGVAVRPDQIMASGSDGMHFGMAPQDSTSTTPTSAKRKRKDAGSAQQSPAKRKTSQASDRGKPVSQSELRRAARKWTDEETDNLLQGCSKYGVGAWKKILDDPSFTFNNRTSVDLKDRFRTIRAQECAQSPYAKSSRKGNAKEPDVVWPLPPNSQRLQGLQRVQRKPTRNYTGDEDRRLLLGVLRHANHWTKIAADPDLKLGNRPGQSLRDRLRNAFPEVFELFGYVIPKKERADRERCPTPAAQPPPTQSKAFPSKRKAPTGSKRLDGEIPDHIREKIMAILHGMNASLDPRPIPEFGVENEDEITGSESPGAEASGRGSMDVDVKCEDSSASRSSRRQSTAGSVAGAGDSEPSEPPLGGTGSRGGRGRRRASTRRTRSTSKAAAAALTAQQQQQHDDIATARNDSIHSAPAHGNPGAAFGQLGDMGAYSDAEQRRAGALGNPRSLLFETFSPSVFSRAVGTMTPTDQLDALALEGRVASGYSTPTQSTKRRHSVQADINDALAAAAMAAGIDRSNFASALQFLHPGLEQTPGTAGASAMPLNAADSIRRMTVAGPIGADPFIFPRLPDEEATMADMSGHMSSTQTAATGVHSAGLTASTAATITPHAVSTSEAFKFSAASAMEPAALSAGIAGHYVDGRDDTYAGHRVQLRSAERLLRANGVADDNSIGLSTTSTGDSRVDLEALTQFSQWFPSLASGSLGWNIASSTGAVGSNGSNGETTATRSNSGQMCSESIDPNMLDAGLGSAATMVGSGGSATASLEPGHEGGMTHARRRSQFDWYGLTPSLAAALDAASTTVTSGSDSSAGLAPFGVHHQGANQPSFRRPSMPIFPTFGFAPTNDMLHMPGAMHTDEIHGSLTTAEPLSYSSGSQDGSGIAAAAAAAAAAVAVALSDGSESLGIHATDPAAVPAHMGMRSYSMGAGSALASGALAKMAGIGGSARVSPAEATTHPRVAGAQHGGRRRTMHVPPSLVEGVASAEFSGSTATRTQRGRRALPYPPPPRPTNAPGGDAHSARARRSRSIGNQNGQQSHPVRPLPAVSETASGEQQTEFPALPTMAEGDEPHTSGTGVGARHTRTYSGTQFSQDALSALAGVSPGLLANVDLGSHHFDLGTGELSGARAGNASGSSVDIDLEAMTSLSASGMELSFKPSLWADDAQLHDETRSLAEARAELTANMVDLYRPASSTGHPRYLGIVGSARNASPTIAAQSAVSPVAPRSAASTPGRREAIEL